MLNFKNKIILDTKFNNSSFFSDVPASQKFWQSLMKIPYIIY